MIWSFQGLTISSSLKYEQFTCARRLIYWLFCCISNSCITRILIYAQTRSFRVLRIVCISHLSVTSWFDSICIVLARWVNLSLQCLHEHELQLSNYNVCTYVRPNLRISCRKILFTILLKLFIVGDRTSSVRCNYCMDSNILFIHSSLKTVVHHDSS